MTTDEVTDSDSPCVSRRSEDGREGARRGDDQARSAVAVRARFTMENQGQGQG